ncbi:MAG: AEC family transporter [Stomatobaculum sp.]|nr:AEC family transporter [Stomatobaculum sp.]
MAFSILLLKKAATLALMILMGFGTVKSGKCKSTDSKVLSQLCFDWVIPLNMINAFMIEYNPETSRSFFTACLFTLGVVPAFIAITMILGKQLKLTPSEQGSLMFSNSAGMTLPLAQSLLGSTGVMLCAPHMVIQNFLIFTVLPRIMSREGKISWKKIFLNRSLLAIGVGFLFFIFQVKLPGVLQDTVSGVSGLMGPLSMFMIGMLMADVDFRKLLSQRKLYLICASRLLLYPLALILLISVSGITRKIPYTREILLVLVMCIASPAATLVTQMATAFRSLEEAKDTGSLNVMTTLLCVVTIPLMVLVYQILC